MMNWKWCRLLAVVPLIGILVGTNVYQDPANIIHDESKEMAQALVDGYGASTGTGNVNEREVKKNLIQYMPDEVDCVVIGPSLAMCITRDDVGTDSFYNLAVSASDLYDILAQFGMMECYGKHAKKVILCVDSYAFDEAIYGYEDAPNRNLMDYTNYMLDVLDGKNPAPVEENQTKVLQTQVEQAFSLTYFQASCEQVQKHGTFSMEDYRWSMVHDDYDGERAFYNSDGSWNYMASVRAHDAAYVQEDSANYNLQAQFMIDRHISRYSMSVYEQLITYLQSQGVEVELYLCPLAPSLWDLVQANVDRFPVLEELESYAHELADTYGLKMTGTYNPYTLGITDGEFYDCRHVRKECLSNYFDFR